jgi:thiol-disulfide isomerase/thioredoxin
MLRVGITLVAIAAMLAGFYLSAQYYSEPLAVAQPSSTGDMIGIQRPEFHLGSNSGEFVTPADYSGKTVLFNFWATWCAPCRREMPMLMDLQREYGPQGLQVVGIALDDVQSAMEFAKTYGISYPILLGEADVMETSDAYGNVDGVLPYSVLVDRDGIIRWQHVGEVPREKISDLLSVFL